ncbi:MULTISPECIES: flagellar hook-basal body complex protein FliE [unclassified Clostridium]|uniref:flagellar hook-basal body complex protein FliE n=1 Tax=unclassified Clostridium TaxID=2614128 RepID=UPI000E7EF2DD|nr:flagellar hook-basal body complex protein FliE [Clostridium sp.]
MMNNYIPNATIFQNELREIYGVKEKDTEENSTSSGTGFAAVIKDELQKVNDLQVEADNNVTGYIAGEKSIHEVVLATEEASMSLELAIQIRNKLVDAYKEFNNMQV